MKRLIYISLLVLLLSACNHKELCLQHPHTVRLKVEYDWQNAPDASPKGMCVFFYPSEGGNYIRADFSGKEGGYVEIPVGKYNVITYNNDTEAVMFANVNDYAGHQAFTREGSVLGPALGSMAPPDLKLAGVEQERVVITPDMLWGYSEEDVAVVEMTTDGEENKLILFPEDLVCHYTYEIRNVNNLKHAVMMCASLSGMSGRLTFSNKELHPECVTIPFEAKIDRENSLITGEFYTFGHHTDNNVHKMLLYVWMDDGQKLYFGADDEDFNLTYQVDTAPNPKRVHLVVDGLELPLPIEDGNGFRPSVDDWTNVNEDIIM